MNNNTIFIYSLLDVCIR